MTNKIKTLLDSLNQTMDENSPIKKGELRIIVDNDSVIAEIDFGCDEEGEPYEDPVYLAKWDSPRELLHEALSALGLPSEDA